MLEQGLPRDWVVRPALDLELKRYTLLAYLQRVERRFGERKLYPHLEDLNDHVDELTALIEGKEAIARAWPGEVLGFDSATGSLVRERPADDEALGVVTAVVEFALPGLRRTLHSGEELRAELMGNIRLEPVGVEPLSPRVGWLLLRNGAEARVYLFTLPLVHPGHGLGAHRVVRTSYVTTTTVDLSNTYERIKATLIARHRHLPNPATYAFEADAPLPCIETFMPLAKHLVYERLLPAA